MDTCAIEHCDKPVKRTGLCYGHYMKQWRYGTPTPQHRPAYTQLIGTRFGTLLVTARIDRQWLCQCECGRTVTRRTGDLNRTGESNTCNAPGQHLQEHVKYGAAHERVKRLHGAPTTHACVDCGSPASHWSYNHDDPNELQETGLSARPLAYSTDPSHYSPRCVPCHKRFDLGKINATYAAA